MNIINQYKGLPAPVYILCAARSIISMGIMFVYPFLSLFLTSNLEFDEVIAGYIMVLTASGSALGALIGGKLSDRFSRKSVFIFASAAVIISSGISGWFSAYAVSIAFIIAMHFSVNIIFPCISAMILDYSTKENQTECYSLMYLCGNIGSATGPAVAGLLFYSHLPWIFYGMSIAFFITMIVIYLLVKDNACRPADSLEPDADAQSSGSISSILARNLTLSAFLFVLVFVYMSYSNLGFAMPMQFEDLCGLDKGSKYSSLVWTVNGISVVCLTPLITNISKKNHNLINVVTACIIYSFSFLVYAFSKNPLLLIAITVFWTCGEILISTNVGIYVTNNLPDSHKGRALALAEFAFCMGRIIGPVVFGNVISRSSIASSWKLVSAFCFSAGIIIFLLYVSGSAQKKEELD